MIQSELHPNGGELRWWCPACEDNGVISNWAGTRWDPARKAERCRSGELFGRQPPVSAGKPSDYKTIQGTITWDEGAEAAGSTWAKCRAGGNYAMYSAYAKLKGGSGTPRLILTGPLRMLMMFSRNLSHSLELRPNL